MSAQSTHFYDQLVAGALYPGPSEGEQVRVRQMLTHKQFMCSASLNLEHSADSKRLNLKSNDPT